MVFYLRSISLALPTALILLVVTAPSWVHAEEQEIRFSEDDLARESVYPVFDEKIAVLKRKVTTEKRFEFNLSGLLLFNEPFFNPTGFGGSVGYHFTELHAVHIMGGFLSNAPSQYVDSIRIASDQNYTYAPAPKNYIVALYEFTPFYGKLSVTKNTIWHLGLNFTAGVGGYSVGTEMLPAIVVGLGQKIFFGSRWGLNVDLKTLTFNGPDAASRDLRPNPPAPPPGTTQTPPNSAFSSRYQTHFLLNVGVVFLL